MQKIESVESVRLNMDVASHSRRSMVQWLARYGGLGPVSESSLKYSQDVAAFGAFCSTLSQESPRWVLRRRPQLLTLLHDSFDETFIRERLMLDVVGSAVQPELSVRVMAVSILDELGEREESARYRKRW